MNYTSKLAFFPKIGPRHYQKLLNYFGSIELAWPATADQIIKSGFAKKLAEEFVAWRKKYDFGKAEAILASEKMEVFDLDDERYPASLKQITDPPIAIFVRGELPALGQPLLSIVGTRRATSYGKQITEEITTILAEQGLGIVSGLALGIDGIAHASTLKSGGYTIGVLGTGIDKKNVYPASHRELAENILESAGALISEYPPGTKATGFSFQLRNRIIAGLSKGTLVTEAPLHSGALITASCALEYNREVFAIPHAVTNQNGEGCNQLLKLGAKLVTNYTDIFDGLNLPLTTEPTRKKLHLNGDPALVANLLGREPVHIDLIIKTTGLPSAAVTSAITLLELKGVIKNLGGLNYIRL